MSTVQAMQSLPYFSGQYRTLNIEQTYCARTGFLYKLNFSRSPSFPSRRRLHCARRREAQQMQNTKSNSNDVRGAII